MTNREKYKFDDFTFTNYRKLIQLAKAQGFEFILHKDDFKAERKDIIWRHDVEFEPDLALKMAQIEHEEGVQATYFFQLHSGYYNLFDQHYTKVFHDIEALGHHCGLHFDCRYWGITDEVQLNGFIMLDREYLEKTLGVELDTFSFHNTTPFTQSCLEYRYGGLINVYSSYFKEHYNYCGDSLATGVSTVWRKCCKTRRYSTCRCSPTMPIGQMNPFRPASVSARLCVTMPSGSLQVR